MERSLQFILSLSILSLILSALFFTAYIERPSSYEFMGEFFVSEEELEEAGYFDHWSNHSFFVGWVPLMSLLFYLILLLYIPYHASKNNGPVIAWVLLVFFLGFLAGIIYVFTYKKGKYKKEESVNAFESDEELDRKIEKLDEEASK